jgi:hypothetical protein
MILQKDVFAILNSFSIKYYGTLNELMYTDYW